MKRTIKLFKIIAIALAIILAIILIKFRPAYSVSLNGENLGYVGDEENFNNEIMKKLINKIEVFEDKTVNIIFNFQ